MELLRELLDLSTLLGTIAPGVVPQTPWTTLVTVEGLPWPLVATWATAPTSRCSSGGGSGSTCQRLVVATGLLLPIPVFVAALSSGICFGLADLPYL
jgi:hypothetical protein